jgi:hypothetical protein
MDESQFLTIVSIIASRHGCRISHVNCDSRIVDIDGPDEAAEACAIDLADALRAYAV